MAAMLELLFWLWMLWSSNNASAEKVSLSGLRGMSPHFQQENSKKTTKIGPQMFFEVSRPVLASNLKPCNRMTLLRHSFGNTINSPPVTLPYNPPQNDSCGGEWDKIVLRWRATCKGRQFDRISAVWLSGVEILRTSTAEPTKTGIVWKVSKDVTKYASLLKTPQILAVVLANVIDNTYTGIFNVTIHLDFYSNFSSSAGSAYSPSTPAGSSSGLAAPLIPADVIFPIALPNSTNGGYWFQLHGENEAGTSSFRLPGNVYKAELEMYISFHGDDEFWYTNPTNEYIQANNLTGTPGNGPYREVLALLDDETIVGEICPMPVIFTGGINPLMWRPVAAIGAFNLPSYTVDVTPFLGELLDGKLHRFTLRVTNSISFWLLDANLHLWLDHGKQVVSGRLVRHSAPPANIRFESEFVGLDGVLEAKAARELSYSGFVVSSFGNLTTTSSYSYKFENANTFSHNGSLTVVKQGISSSSKVEVIGGGSEGVSLKETFDSFPLHLSTNQVAGKNKSVVLDVRISHGIKKQHVAVSNGFNYSNSLYNSQDARGHIVIQGNLVTSGYGELKQSYVFDSSNSDECYSRNLKTRNYMIPFDEVSRTCLDHDFIVRLATME